MLAVAVEAGAAFRHGSPRTLFAGQYELDPRGDAANYDVTPDGQRFLMLQDHAERVSGQLHVVLNWHNELGRVVTLQR